MLNKKRMNLLFLLLRGHLDSCQGDVSGPSVKKQFNNIFLGSQVTFEYLNTRASFPQLR